MIICMDTGHNRDGILKLISWYQSFLTLSEALYVHVHKSFEV